MAKIYAPNKDYNGVSASVTFVRGVGETENPHLIKWFKERGYSFECEDSQVPNKLENMNVEQLKDYAKEHSIDIGNSTSVNGILKKIKDAEKQADVPDGEEEEQEV